MYSLMLIFFFLPLPDNDFSRRNLYEQDLPNYFQTWYVVFLIVYCSSREKENINVSEECAVHIRTVSAFILYAGVLRGIPKKSHKINLRI